MEITQGRELTGFVGGGAVPTGIPIPLLPEAAILLPTKRLPKVMENDLIGLAIAALPVCQAALTDSTENR